MSLKVEEAGRRENQRDGSRRRTQPDVVDLEDGGRSHEPRKVGSS